jgi:hypothetical protein
MTVYLTKDLSGEKIFTELPYKQDGHYMCNSEKSFLYVKTGTVYKLINDNTYGMWEYDIDKLNIFGKIGAILTIFFNFHSWNWKYLGQYNEYSKEQNKRRNNLNAKWQSYLNANYSDWDYPSQLMLFNTMNKISGKIEKLGYTKFDNDEVEFLINKFAESIKD